MKSFGTFEAKTHFSRILNLVEDGEEVEITRHGRPVAKVVPVKRRRPTREKLERIATELDAFRESHPLGDLTIKELIEEGRRY
jgi:prevent-host-death family protein